MRSMLPLGEMVPCRPGAAIGVGCIDNRSIWRAQAKNFVSIFQFSNIDLIRQLASVITLSSVATL